MKRSILLFSVLSWLFSYSCASSANEDIPGSSDHHEVGRYPGSYITGYAFSEYDSYTYPHEKRAKQKQADYVANLQYLEGERTSITYSVPLTVTTSVLKVFRSIEKGLNEKGFQAILSCGGEVDSCGSSFSNFTFKRNNAAFKERILHLGVKPRDLFAYTGVLEKEKATYTIFVLVSPLKNAKGIAVTYDILKPAALKTEELVLSAADIKKGIDTTGKVELGGLYFETNSTVLKSTSEPALAALVEYLNANKNSEYLVVGHTDTEGGFDYNVKLSKNRAQSVMSAAKKKLAAPHSTLTAVGIGFAAPLASNASADGRGKNRRVELVLVKR